MLTLTDTPAELDDLAQNMKSLLRDVLDAIPPKKINATINAQEEPLTYDNTSIYYIKDGVFKLFCGGKLVRFFMEGDLVGLERFFGYSNNVQVVNEFGALVDIYHGPTFYKNLYRSNDAWKKWEQYTAAQIYLTEQIAALYISEDIKPSISMQNFAPGDVIIEEGSMAEDIYDMINGVADVFFEDKKVGEVGAKEVFGEISFLTGQKRSASMIAQTPCLVSVIKGCEFKLLMKYRPQLVLKIARGLAKRVVDLNLKVANL